MPCCRRGRPHATASRPAAKSSTTRPTTRTRPRSTPVRASPACPDSILEMTGQPADAAQPGALPGQPADLQADLSARIPEGQHDLRSGPRSRAADRMVGQAPRLRSPQRAVGQRDRRPVHARDRQQRARTRRHPVPGRNQLDRRQRRDDAVRLLQGPGGPQRDRRLRPQPHDEGRRAGDLRDELPDRLDRREAAHIGRSDRRLPARHHHARAAARSGRSTTSTRSCRRWTTRSRRRASRTRPRSSSRPSTASRRRTRIR